MMKNPYLRFDCSIIGTNGEKSDDMGNLKKEEKIHLRPGLKLIVLYFNA